MGSPRKWVRLYLDDWKRLTAGLTRIQESMMFDIAVVNWQRRSGVNDADMALMFGDVDLWRSQIAQLDGFLVHAADGVWLRAVRQMVARTCDPGRMATAMWKAARLRIFERDGYVCTYCGAADQPLECDHIYPVAKGGTDDEDNLTTACKPCNRSKRDLTVAEWRAL